MNSSVHDTCPRRRVQRAVLHGYQKLSEEQGTASHWRNVAALAQPLACFVVAISTSMHFQDFVILMIAFGIGLAEFNAITTLIEQIIRPSGYSKVL